LFLVFWQGLIVGWPSGQFWPVPIAAWKPIGCQTVMNRSPWSIFARVLVLVQRAIAGNAAWKRWHSWHPRHIVFCNLQNLKRHFGNESHSLRHIKINTLQLRVHFNGKLRGIRPTDFAWRSTFIEGIGRTVCDQHKAHHACSDPHSSHKKAEFAHDSVRLAGLGQFLSFLSVSNRRNSAQVVLAALALIC
jgi:hypothetical protein